MPHPRIREQVRAEDIHRKRQPFIHDHQPCKTCHRMYGRAGQEQQDTEILQQTRLGAECYGKTALRKIQLPEDRPQEAVPSADGCALARQRESQGRRHHRTGNQPGNSRNGIRRTSFPRSSSTTSAFLPRRQKGLQAVSRKWTAKNSES